MALRRKAVGTCYASHLTTGADTITGTAGNDAITALTIKADGSVGETFSSFDAIDGGAGTDTLNIYTTATENEAFPTSGVVKNVEIVNVYNTAAAAAFGDASKFAGVTQLWQHGASTNVTNLAATTTAGFKGLTLSANADQAGVNTTATARSVTATAAATSIAVALDGVKGDAATGVAVAAGAAVQGLNATTQNQVVLNLSGAALADVTVSGTIAKATTTAGAAAATLALGVTAGTDVESLKVNTAVATILTVTENASSGAAKDIKTLDASASTGAITFGGSITGGTAGSLATIKTGAGADTVTIVTATLKDDTATTTVNEAVSALVDTGAGNDKIIINTTGTGTTNVEAGAGNDTVTLTGHSTGILTVNLGAGNDTFKGTGAVSATDVINAGDGTDTLLLNMVGSSNIGAFSNFENFDAAALAKTLDVEILAAKNTVTEFVATADVGATAVLTNVGAGVGYRVTGDTNVDNALTLTQKTAGALTITLDIDEAATTAANFDSGAKTNVDAAVIASNATSIKAVFDSSFKDAAITGDTTDNLTNLTVTGTKATSLEVVSGGAFAINDLAYTYGKGAASAGIDGLLETVVVTGDRAISLSFSDGTNDAESNIATVDASGLKGSLKFSTADLATESAANVFDGGVLKLGAGADVITIVQGANISGLGIGSAEAATAQGQFDVLSTGSAVQQAVDVAATAALTIKDGLFTFNGTGPATLAAAVAAVTAQLITTGDAVVFEYVGNSYVFVDGGVGADLVVKLTGVTGLHGLDEVGTSNTLYAF